MSLEELVLTLLNTPDLDKDHVFSAKREYARINKISGLPSNMQMLKVYHDLVSSWQASEHKIFQQLLKKRAIRSQSGIVSVQVLTKPFWCPGKCIFCPNDFTMPKSYINTEPWAMRALLNNFDPVKQVYNRLLSLYLTGHDTDKIEMIVLGGTRDVYPTEYKKEFIKWLYDACNTFPEFLKTVTLTQSANKSLFAIEDGNPPVKGDKGGSTEDSVQSLIANAKLPSLSGEGSGVRFGDTVEESIRINETAAHRMIGLTVETRPEYVTDENCRLWRELGITRLEMGIQSTNDTVLDMNKRWHSVKQCKLACHRLRQYGFKFSVHLMPGLYGSDEEKDLQTFIDIYGDPAFRPDEIKFYPTSVIPNTELYDLYKSGEYKPIETESIQRIITTTFRDIIPPYTRIKRLIRDIPSTEIVAWSATTNLSQLMHEWLYKQWRNTDTIRSIYERLYEHTTYYDTVESYYQTSSPSLLLAEKGDHKDKSPSSRYGEGLGWGLDITTSIIGWPIDIESDRAFVSLDTRSREIRHRRPHEPEDIRIVIRAYRSSVGREYFIAMETSQWYLYWFTRLLLPDVGNTIDYIWLGEGTALIRELHVYGQVTPLGKGALKEVPLGWGQGGSSVQHTGVGRTVMTIAEQISKQAWYHRLSVIAGVGVKEYYRNQLWYHDEGTYVVKKLS